MPIRCNAEPADLPTGYSDTLVRALDDHARGADCDTLVVCAAQVCPDRAGAGIAATALRALFDVAAKQGLAQIVVSLRLTGKHRYPLTPIQQYASWTRPDGTPLDAWLRTHLAMGARVVATNDSSQIFHGTTAQWQDWSGLPIPATRHLPGAAGASSTTTRPRRRTGTLAEPGVWVRHR